MRPLTTCHRCRGLIAQSRQASSSAPAAQAARLSRKSVLEISGPDTQKFLKGLTCKDVEPIQGGYSGFLNASGRVLHDVFIFPVQPDRYLITHESPPNHPAPLQKYLQPFKLRSKVRFKDVSAEWDAWGMWGVEAGSKPERKWKAGSLGAAEASWSWPDGIADLGLRSQEVGCWDLRAGVDGLGQQILVPAGSEPLGTISSESDYHLNRMRLGIPEGPQELVSEAALPMESCMDVHGGVDFRKGCYVGQELTVRTYHTGATRKRILPISLFPLRSDSALPADLSPGEALTPGTFGEVTYHPPASSSTKKPKSAGKILSLHDTYGSVGLGLLRLEMVERTWWNQAPCASVDEWLNGGSARLTTVMSGTEYGVYVGKAEAYAASLGIDP
ncbi:putative transferase CAF17, mitochondrial [Dioszegia hungarica]|uniref:Transferase CAF17, mitochondrial n=1 Tax=Dioszegia hungarica TaxID=4972 RepID=A0AA38H1Q4_9TREE|nr:putative transferase CAF17, mitochondrial [Dioszegia hungarica]KAI9632121.1 putative transferase CAF17, mitochondrial [Dioszegia hungarica]